MGDWSLGSVAEFVYNSIDGIPTGISGNLTQIADAKREFVSNYTGTPIDSNSIPLKYQNIISLYTLAQVASQMNAYGVDATSVRLGDFSVSDGAGSNLEVLSSWAQKAAETELQTLGRTISYFKANG